MSADLCLMETAERLFGGDVRDCLWNVFGGQYVDVPSTDKQMGIVDGGNTQRLRAILGEDRFAVLMEAVGGVRFYVPVSPDSQYRQRCDIVIDLSLEGKGIADIARSAQCTERQVYNIRKKMREQGLVIPASKIVRKGKAPDIRRRLLDGEDDAAIASAVGCNPGSVRRVRAAEVRKGNLPSRRSPTNMAAEIRERLAKGQCQPFVAANVGCPKHYVTAVKHHDGRRS